MKQRRNSGENENRNYNILTRSNANGMGDSVEIMTEFPSFRPLCRAYIYVCVCIYSNPEWDFIYFCLMIDLITL